MALFTRFVISFPEKAKSVISGVYKFLPEIPKLMQNNSGDSHKMATTMNAMGPKMEKKTDIIRTQEGSRSWTDNLRNSSLGDLRRSIDHTFGT